jgi:hypothetical protein
MRILISEEALQTGDGHWPNYIGCIAEGMRVAGDEVEVLVHRQATQELAEQLRATPYLTKNCWVDPTSHGVIGGIRHNFLFHRDLSAWLCSHAPYDWVCALTMRLQHLLAFALLSRNRSVPSHTRFLLLFVQGFGQYAGHGNATTFQKSPSMRLARWCFRLMEPAVRKGTVVLAAETRGMQDELQRFTGLPVVLFPHPVTAPSNLVRAETQIERDIGAPITITCPGFARHEKGNDLLQEAIRILMEDQSADPLHFVMQWPETFKMPDGVELGPDRVLMAHPRISFLNQSLDAVAYEALLARTDVVILPYRCESYHNRLSRVAVEAASRGIPLIYTQGTWTGEVADLVGDGVMIRDESASAVVSALRTALTRLSQLKKNAVNGADRVVRFHSSAAFRALLEKL